MEELRRLVYGNKLAVRRRLADVVASLPAFKEREVTIGYEVTEGLLEAMRGKPRGRTIEGMIERDDPYLSTIMRELGKAKAEGIADYIAQVREEEQDGRGTLVLFWHHDTADRIQELLSLHPLVQRIDGNTSSKNKAKIEDAFNRGEVAVLLGQIASMGVSINLQEGGNHVIFAETGWSPAAIKQAYHRVLRWGQEKDVQVDYCVSEHEVDIAVANVRERKQLGINQLHGENR